MDEPKLFLDLVISLTPAVDETIPYLFYQRSTFKSSRRLLLIQWLLWANIISHAYKGTLLSTLINIRYTEALDTMDQMYESGMEFFVLDGTAMEWLTNTDPRDGAKRLTERRRDIPFDGAVKEEHLKMYYILIKL